MHDPAPHTAQPTELLPVTRWHPKMSPYRTSVIITTVILGTMKAIFVYKGVSMVSTTLEWIAGVVFALLFFALDEWESDENYPKRLPSFFTFDCAELVWKLLDAFSISRPRYRSDESRAWLRDSLSIPVTGYRILVSTTVVVLGSTKAVLAFLGQNTSANYLDWILGALITSVLYYIGLYESNSANLAANFFVRDQHTIVSRICRDISFLLGVGVCLWGLVEVFATSLSHVKSNFHIFMNTLPTQLESFALFTLIQSLGLFILCGWAFMVIATSAGIVGIPLLIGWLLLQEREYFRPLFRRGSLASRCYDRLTHGMVNVISSPPRLFRQACAVVRSILLVAFCVLGIVASSSYFSSMISLMKLMVENFGSQGGIGKVMDSIGMLLLGYLAIIGLLMVCGFIWALSLLPASLAPVFE